MLSTTQTKRVLDAINQYPMSVELAQHPSMPIIDVYVYRGQFLIHTERTCNN